MNMLERDMTYYKNISNYHTLNSQDSCNAINVILKEYLWANKNKKKKDQPQVDTINKNNIYFVYSFISWDLGYRVICDL